MKRLHCSSESFMFNSQGCVEWSTVPPQRTREYRWTNHRIWLRRKCSHLVSPDPGNHNERKERLRTNDEIVEHSCMAECERPAAPER